MSFKNLINVFIEEQVEANVFIKNDQVLLEDSEYQEWTKALSILGEDKTELALITSEDLFDYEAIRNFAKNNLDELEVVEHDSDTIDDDMYSYNYNGIPVIICLGAVDAVIVAKEDADLLTRRTT